LQLSGYAVDGAEDGKQALKCLSEGHYDVMLLDLNMPVLNGQQVLEHVLEHYPDLQVIILTAHATLDSAIAAVKAGAADYLLKPQSIAQIDKAIQRALKRQFNQLQRRHLVEIIGEAMHTLQIDDDLQSIQTIKPDSPVSTLNLNGITFDPVRRKLLIYDDTLIAEQSTAHTIDLTSHQSAILTYMIFHPMKVLSCMEISCKALGYQNLTKIEAEHITRPHILKLRRKIEKDPSNPQLIQSVRGEGYLFSPP
jgi:two-component system KDP operon response regulator KdpE